MGSYVYTKRAKVVEATTADGTAVLVNTYQYATKPYWNLWDARPASYMADYEKAAIRGYYLIRATADRTVDKLLAKGQLSRLFVSTHKGKVCFETDGTCPVFEFDEYARWIVDDDMGGRSMPHVGDLRKNADGSLVFIPKAKTYAVGDLIPISECTDADMKAGGPFPIAE